MFKKALIKTVTWRLIAAVDTFVAGYLLTGHMNTAAGLVGAAALTHTVWYYGHELAWAKVKA